ncbi:copper homeostasis membrane protein CopD [Methylovirgula sp. 4M-Z18]|uniref:copper homeostasis membrane protein CopD n=1 Tax=Methylovirgula sp. 4M-Z18 TaxID=2293567 RepID=UPI000E2E7A45|nr:copper homeostasis membrane protein CopD [Methylovirgula sp. 4M-Z18]RFB78225.1 hypothetical protein DYH55_17815 [Methylovirgula sp. 4M-Z18]
MEFDPEIWARWIQFASVVGMFGTSLFPFYAAPAERFAPSFWRIVQGAALLAIASGCAWLTFSVADVGDTLGDPSLWRTYLLETSFGHAWLVRLALYPALLIVLVFQPRQYRFVVAAALGGALLVSQALLGHAAAASGGLAFVAILSYAVHVLAAGLWLGGLLPLLLVLRAPTDGLSAEQHVPVLQRFSRAGYFAVVAIALSAAVNVWLHVGDWQNLRGNAYGWLLLDKLILFAVLIVLASLNRFALLPRLMAHGSDTAQVTRLLASNVLFEILLGLGILAVAALLGTTAPP